MNTFDQLKKIIKETSEACGIREYEVYYKEDASVSAETYRDEISAFSSSVGGLFLYRCIVDGKIGYSSTECMEEEEMKNLVRRAAENAAVIEKDEEAVIYAGAPQEAYGKTAEVPFDMPDASEIREEAMKCRNLVYDSDKMVADGTECGTFAGHSIIRLFNANGLDLSCSVGNCGEYIEAVLDNENEKQFDYDFLYNSFDKDDSEKQKLADRVIADAKAKFGAGTVKTGRYNIIFDRRQMSDILSTFVSAFYAENVQKGLSLLKGKTGKSIASPCISITDTPFMEGNTMQISFDGEGVPTREKAVVENGVLKTFLYNLASARKDGAETTGNAARTASSIGTRPYSFFINPGKLTKDELLAKAGNGILVTEMKGFHAGANAVTGDFSIESAGFLIKDGKIDAPVKSFTVAGNFFSMLKEISDVDDNLVMDAPGFTQIASPDVFVPDMSVAGE